MKKIEGLIKAELKSVPPEKKFQFLDQLNYDLGHLIGSNYKKMNLDHKKASEIPKWVKTGYSFIPYFDHFGRPNIIPRRKGDKDKWDCVSNPYFLTYEALETMIEEMKRYGIKFDIVGESNYFPGRTFQIRFRKMKSTDRKSSKA
jgi:hypothetical protein